MIVDSVHVNISILSGIKKIRGLKMVVHVAISVMYI